MARRAARALNTGLSPEALRDQVEDGERLVGEVLTRLRAGGIAGADVLRFLATAVFARRNGLDLEALPSRLEPRERTTLLDATKLALISVASLAQPPGPHRDVARWALEQLHVTVADLGMEKEPLPPTDDEALESARRTLRRISAVAERAWGPPGVRPS